MSNPAILQAVQTAFAAAAGATVSGPPPVVLPAQQANLGGKQGQGQGVGGGGNQTPLSPPALSWASYSQWTADFQSDNQQNNYLTCVGWTFGDSQAPVIVDDLGNVWDLFTIAFPNGSFLVIGTAQNQSSGPNSVSLCAANANSGVLQSVAEVDGSLIVQPSTTIQFPADLSPAKFVCGLNGVQIN